MDTDDDDLLQRFIAGEPLAVAEQQLLAAQLRRDPALRQRLRNGLRGEQRLVQAVRTSHVVRPLTTRRLRRTRRGPTLAIAMAAAAVLVIGSLLLAGWLAGTPVSTKVTQPIVEAVQDQGAFELTERTGRAVLPDHSRVELDAFSTGTITGRAMSLEAGGVRLRPVPDAEDLRIEAGPATITVRGEVAVRYLDVPEGSAPAIHVQVATGHARIDIAGTRHELARGDSHLVAPDGRLQAVVVAVDHRHIELQAGNERLSWSVDRSEVMPMDEQGRELPPEKLQPGWKVRVMLSSEPRTVTGIEVPPQQMSGTVLSWDGNRRILCLDRDRFGRQPPMLLAEGIDERPVKGRSYRLRVDPATLTVLDLDPEVRGQKARSTYAAEERVRRTP